MTYVRDQDVMDAISVTWCEVGVKAQSVKICAGKKLVWTSRDPTVVCRETTCARNNKCYQSSRTAGFFSTTVIIWHEQSEVTHKKKTLLEETNFGGICLSRRHSLIAMRQMSRWWENPRGSTVHVSCPSDTEGNKTLLSDPPLRWSRT